MKKIFVSIIIFITIVCSCNLNVVVAINARSNINTVSSDVSPYESEEKQIDMTANTKDEKHDKQELIIENEEKTDEIVQHIENSKQQDNDITINNTVIQKQQNEIQENTVEEGDDKIISDEVDFNLEKNLYTNNEGEIENSNSFEKHITFTYNNKQYSVKLTSEEMGIDLTNYYYYFVIKNSETELALYCSNTRVTIQTKWNGQPYAIGSNNTILAKINTNGTIEKSIVDISGTTLMTPKEIFIASNQNIYFNEQLHFEKNSGYEYDIENETTETCNELVKVTATVYTYELPAIYYDTVAVIQEGMVVKRTKKSVNEHGCVWDKIELSNGKEVYINSARLELVTDTKEINFTYNEKPYTVYLSQSSLNENINLRDYYYYFVIKNSETELALYCSNTRVTIQTKWNGQPYAIGSNNTILVKISTNGTIEKSIVDISGATLMTPVEIFVASNQNIYFNGQLHFAKNSGYVYDVANETKETCNELVKVTATVYTYELPAIYYDTVAVIQEGMVVKRTKKSVNEHGCVWDKIELSNGKEVYINSARLELVTDTKEINFTYNEKPYTVYLSQSSLNENINLRDYYYYFVIKNSETELALYCSNTRVTIQTKWNGQPYAIGSNNTILVKINTNGTIEKSIVDISGTTLMTPVEIFVASNQNIYFNEQLFFTRNSGYNYNIEEETTEICNELVKITAETTIHIKPDTYYDKIGTIKVGQVIKRIKKSVNEVDGWRWDKIKLSNGKEAYIKSAYLEIVTDTKEINFQYKKEPYTVYLSQSTLNKIINLDDYNYFIVGKEGETGLKLYYSTEPIIVTSNSTIDCGLNTIVVTINKNGITRKTISQPKLTLEKFECVATSNDVYCGNRLIYNINNYMYIAKAYFRYNEINNFNDSIDGIYTDKYYETIKECQRLFLMTPNGNLNDKIINKMGLDEIENYDTYLKIGENYNQYQCPYGPKTYLEEDDELKETEYELGINRAIFKSREAYADQEAKYNLMGTLKKIEKQQQLNNSIYGLEYIAALCSPVYPHTATGIAQFLSNTGKTLYVNDVEDIFSMENQRKMREQYMQYTKNAIEYLLTVNKDADFSMVKTVSVMLPASNNKEIDWFGLYGTYSFSVEGHCYKAIDNTYRAEGYCYVRDYYDFDKVDWEYICGTIEDIKNNNEFKFDFADIVYSRLADLHYAGMARFFYIEGRDNGFLLEWKNNE